MMRLLAAIVRFECPAQSYCRTSNIMRAPSHKWGRQCSYTGQMIQPDPRLILITLERLDRIAASLKTIRLELERLIAGRRAVGKQDMAAATISLHSTNLTLRSHHRR